MDSSIGFAAAKFAQEQGATVLISNFGRALGITRRIAKRLPQRAAGARARRDRRRAPRRARRRRSASTSTASTASCTRSPTATRRRCSAASSSTARGPTSRTAVQVSAYSLKSLTDGLPAADAVRRLGRRADLRRDGRLAGVRLDGRRQGRRSSRRRATWPATSARTGSGSTWSPPARCARWPPRRSRASSDLEDMWGDAGAAGLGQRRPRADRQGGLRAAVRLVPGDHRRDRARRRRLPRDGCLTAPLLGNVPGVADEPAHWSSCGSSRARTSTSRARRSS